MRLDWTTLALQTVNVLVLLWLLRRFLFRPVVEIIAARKNTADKLLADAAAARDQAKAEAERVAQREKELAAQSDHILSAARSAAEVERAQYLEQGRKELAQSREAGDAKLAEERAQMRRELEGEARVLALTIASRLLGRMPAPALSVALLQSLETWLAALPAEELRALARPGEAVEVVTAAPLDAASQAACREMLGRRLGNGVELRFGVDPSLIAGVELRSGHARLRNNWQADLDRLAQGLSRDDEQLAVA
jgi:F-type H+-transporting ATPase subunit b